MSLIEGLGTKLRKQLTDDRFQRLSDTEQALLKRARLLAEWMDDKISVAGFGIGLDGIIGLIPIGGDVMTALIGLYHLHIARSLKLSLGTQISLLINILLDFLIGFVPVLGDLFDFVYKSHRRNLKLIERKLAERLGETA